MRENRGFTLMELMIVVAIIAIMATLAVGFIFAHRAKAVRAEAKSNLGAIYRSELAFRGEHDTFTDNLERVGYVVTGSPKFIYGFTTDAVPSASGVNDTAELRTRVSGYSTKLMIDAFGNPLREANLPTSEVTKDRFVVGAAANLDQDSVLEKWTLDSDNLLTSVIDDLGD